MTSTFRNASNSYFLTEAQDLLQTIEQGVFSLRSDRTPANVHALMRAAHTLKGAAASVGLSAVNNVAHVLEDIFRAFYNPEVEIDAEIEGLLFQGYECLRLLLTAQFDGSQVDESGILNRAADIIARLQAKLGDRFDRDAPIPTSAELGFDMVQSMFELGVTQRLEELAEAMARHAPDLADLLRSQTEIFLGLAESLELPGFAAIAQTTLKALDCHPEAVQTIAQVALQDFSQGRSQVLAGDRQQGGTPSLQLQQLADPAPIQPAPLPQLESPAPPPQPPPSPLLASLLSLLQTEIPLENWLCQLKTWMTPSRKSSSLTLPVISSAAANDSSAIAPSAGAPFAGDASAELPPTLPLEALLSGLETQPGGTTHPDDSELVIAFNPTEPRPAPDRDASHDVLDPTAWSVSLAADASEQNSTAISDPWLVNSSSPNLSEAVNSFSSNALLDTATDSTSERSSDSFPDLPSDPSKNPARSTLQRDVVSFKSASVNPASPLSTPSVSVRVDLEKLEKLNYLTGELLINQNQQVSQDDALRLVVQELLDRLQKHQQTIDALCSQGDRLFLSHRFDSGKSTEGFSSITQQFDELEMDRYSEIHVLSRSTLHEVMELKSISETLDQTARQFRRSLEAQQRLLFMVGNDLTAIRMQPLEDLFQRLTQVVQQLSMSHNKPVEIRVTGAGVLVDKTIVEKLYDPLLHLARNAFDHGIEPAEVRQAMGKPAIGRIEINAYPQGHRTIIEVKDDGPGVNLQRVAQRAIENGWLTQDAIATTPESTLLSYLFEPGFSTAAQVSDLSGRGVGLDVVRSQVEGFKGAVAISFLPQQGTTFSLQIPLSLTIAKLLVCKTQGISYALPIDAIEQIVSRSDALLQVGSQQVLKWRQGNEEKTIVVRPLSNLLSDVEVSQSLVADPSEAPASRSIILIRSDTGLMGVQVDQVLGEQELVIRPLGQAIAPPPYVYGCCIVGNNQLALVIDIKTLLQQVTNTTFGLGHQAESSLSNSQCDSISISDSVSSSTSNLSPKISPDTLPEFSNLVNGAALPAKVKRSPRHFHILLIEDSLTLRQTLAQLLQQVGYQVSQAKDGLEGLAFLQQHPGVDLVLCDIEMPRMNGFEFLSQRQQHLSLAKIPVIMLTSRSSAKYRQFALELGAADFITKPYVDQNLLSTIQHLLVQS